MTESEVWRDIEGFEGIYQVSNLGRVRGLDRIVEQTNGKQKRYKEKIKKQSITNDGYMYVSLCSKRYLVHRLVAETFLPNTDNLPEVNHIDENKTNNKVDNLEWCDRRYNLIYSNLTKPVNQYTLSGEFVRRWDSMLEIQKTLGFFESCINVCVRHKQHHHSAYGFKWFYVDDQTQPLNNLNI